MTNTKTMEIQLTKGKIALVDEADYATLMQWRWYVDGQGYACREKRCGGGKKIKITMHRQIHPSPDGMYTDHINGNTLDNRKTNLRSVTPSENCYNRKLRSDARNKHKGIQKSHTGRWYAKIQHQGICRHLGGYATEQEAAQAYNSAAKEHFGEYARLNSV